MNADTPKEFEGILPWNFEMTIDGQTYKTVRPTVGTIAKLTALSGVLDVKAPVEAAKLFADPKPDIEAWDHNKLCYVISSFMTFFGHETSKNSRLVAKQAQDTISKAVKN